MATANNPIKYLIIGAGPTGLGAAWRLKELGKEQFLIVERNNYMGGLAHTFTDENGFLWDIGGHVQFSHYHYFDEVMKTVIPSNEWLTHRRASFVFTDGRYIPYPFQRNINYLANKTYKECLAGLKTRKSKNQFKNFEEWIYATFGEGIAHHFMIPYNQKVWAFPLNQLAHSWISERVATVKPQDVLKGQNNTDKKDNWGPNAFFQFPKKGGTGQIWENTAKHIGEDKILINNEVVLVDIQHKYVQLRDGHKLSYEYLLSTMPIDKLTAILIPNQHKESQLTNKLLHSSTHVVGIGIEGNMPKHLKDKSWIYFPMSNSPYYRITVFSNYSPYNVPDNNKQWSLMTETSSSVAKGLVEQELINQTINALKEDKLISSHNHIISTFYHKADYGYPTPSLKRDNIVNQVLHALELKDIYSRGRFGAWKYEVSNQDHSFMQGVEWTNRVVNGQTETTLYYPEFVNQPTKR